MISLDDSPWNEWQAAVVFLPVHGPASTSVPSVFRFARPISPGRRLGVTSCSVFCVTSHVQWFAQILVFCFLLLVIWWWWGIRLLRLLLLLYYIEFLYSLTRWLCFNSFGAAYRDWHITLQSVSGCRSANMYQFLYIS